MSTKKKILSPTQQIRGLKKDLKISLESLQFERQQRLACVVENGRLEDHLYQLRRQANDDQNTFAVLREATQVLTRTLRRLEPAPPTPKEAKPGELWLTEIGLNVISTIKEVRGMTFMGLKESKDLVVLVRAGTPQRVKEGLNHEQALVAIAAFQRIGATAACAPLAGT